MKLRLLFLGILLCLGLHVVAGEMSVIYVKSLGVLSPSGAPMFSVLGNVAIDEQGNLYGGTPGGGSALMKMAPDGAIVWQTFKNLPGFQGVAIDKDFVYTCGGGFYGYRQLQRWNKASGSEAEGWQYEWKDKDTAMNGVRPLTAPVSLVVDDTYLYVVDNGGDELRRFDKKTGVEKPFAAPIKVVKPIDIAFAKNGNLLLLTASSLAELTKDGQPVNIPLIKDLHKAVAVAVQPQTGNLFLAVGGSEDELWNKVVAYTPDGQPVEDFEIGAGGDYNGKWSSRAFAFSGGTGDIAFDPQGGLWVNPGWSHRQWLLPTLEHFTPTEFKNDRTLSALTVPGGYMDAIPLLVDDQLNVYPHGEMKFTWDNKLQWTSGLIASGDMKQYPTTVFNWVTMPMLNLGKMVVALTSGNSLYSINPERGTATGKTVANAIPDGTMSSACTVGPTIYLVRAADGALFTTDFELTKITPAFTPPADDKVQNPAIAVSPDAERFFYTFGGKTVCYTKDGKKQWETPSGYKIAGVAQDLLFVDNANYAPGVLALDAKTGEQIAIIGDKATDGRPAVSRVNGMALGSKDGRNYLFVATQGRIMVFRFERNQEE